MKEKIIEFFKNEKHSKNINIWYQEKMPTILRFYEGKSGNADYKYTLIAFDSNSKQVTPFMQIDSNKNCTMGFNNAKIIKSQGDKPVVIYARQIFNEIIEEITIYGDLEVYEHIAQLINERKQKAFEAKYKKENKEG